ASADTANVINVNSVPTGTVTVDNITPSEGDVLSASNTLVDADGLGVISYQWQRGTANIAGATAATYTTVQADVGAAIRVIASYTDGQGTAESVTSADTANVVNVNDAPTGTVTVDNMTPNEGDVLTASNTLADADGLGVIIYQWQRGGVNIAGATAATYTTVQADVGAPMRVIASYTDGEGTAESVTSAATANVVNVNDLSTGTVTVDNMTPSEGDVLTASNTLADADGLGVISYQWQRGGVDIAGATAATYTTVQADVGAAIRVIASYTDGQGTAESVASVATANVVNVNDAPTGTVIVDNVTPIEGDVLSASNTLADADGLGVISYQWQRGGVNIAGATAATYTTVQADVGAPIRVLASYTDTQGTTESVNSAATANVVNVNDAPTGAVTIDNSTPTEGDVLTVSNTLADEDGLGAISYQWQRGGLNIAGATAATYITTQADVGAPMGVVASYVDLLGTSESISAADTAPVAEQAVPTVIGGELDYTGSEGDSAVGVLTITDVAGNVVESSFGIVAQPTNGIASIDPDSGSWIFTPSDPNWFGSDNFTVEILSENGIVNLHTVDVSLVSVNDIPLIGGIESGTITEDATLLGNEIVVAGELTISDSDIGESSFQTEQIVAAFGTFSIDAAGNWTYSADNNQPDIQRLDTGQTLSEELTVTTFDGSTHTIRVNINGAEDDPVIAGIVEGFVTRGEASVYSNSLTISDIDSADNPISFSNEENALGDNGFGFFTLRSETWTYTLNDNHPAVLGLGAHETLSDTYTFLASDGSSQIVSITILNDPAPSVAMALPEITVTVDQEVLVDTNDMNQETNSETDSMEGEFSEAPAESSVVTVNVPSENEEIADTPQFSNNPQPILIYQEEATPRSDTERKVTNRTEYSAPAPITDLLAFDLLLDSVQGLEQSDQYAAIESERVTRESFRRGVQTMREEMTDAANEEGRSEQIADLVLRVSGVSLSAGSLAWLLQSGSLFASALSSIPTWQGFDPLPVLAKQNKRRRWGFRKRIEAEDREEREAGRILDSVNHLGSYSSQQNREGSL
ncbi:MAG: VCBS domain-containing protein, partial [Granulosicoccus sp.]